MSRKVLFIVLMLTLSCFACATIPKQSTITNPDPDIVSYHFFKTDFHLVRSGDTIILKTQIGRERDPQFLRLRLEAQLNAEVLRLVAGAKENPPNIFIIKENLDGHVRNLEVSLTALSPEGYAYVDLRDVTVNGEYALPLIARFFK